jgi:hypothetical protein
MGKTVTAVHPKGMAMTLSEALEMSSFIMILDSFR